MTLERVSPHPVPEDQAVYSPPTLVYLQDKIAEKRFSPKEREMLDAFYIYAETTEGLDIRNAQPKQSEQIALAANGFFSHAVNRRIEEDAELGLSPRLYAIPSAPVERRLRDYYGQFGTNRREKTGALLAKEEQHLAAAKRPLFVKSYGGGNIDQAGVQTPITEHYTRIEMFPQVRFALKLEELLRNQGNITAADSLEALTAAYGAWFPERLQLAAAHSLIQRVSVDPEDDIK